jgi:hypothetical protein
MGFDFPWRRSEIETHADGNEHAEKNRQNAGEPSLVEVSYREAALGELQEDDLRYQEAGNHEEDIYAREAAAEGRHLKVKEYDRHDGKGAQAVDVFSVFHGTVGAIGSAKKMGEDVPPCLMTQQVERST